MDLYVERQHKLRVPFEELQAYAQNKMGMWVACPEHLLVLKLGAIKDRGHSAKGQKDKEDLAKLLLVIDKDPNCPLLNSHLNEDDKKVIGEIVNNREINLALADGNAHIASRQHIAKCGKQFMKYAAYSKMARTHKPGPLTPLDDYCRSAGVSYFVSVSHPTLFEFDPSAEHVFINYPDKSATIPASEKDDAEHILSLLAYVGQRYDALETIAHLHIAALNNASSQNLAPG